MCASRDISFSCVVKTTVILNEKVLLNIMMMF